MAQVVLLDKDIAQLPWKPKLAESQQSDFNLCCTIGENLIKKRDLLFEK
jgi:hypothetical protein